MRDNYMLVPGYMKIVGYSLISLLMVAVMWRVMPEYILPTYVGWTAIAVSVHLIFVRPALIKTILAALVILAFHTVSSSIAGSYNPITSIWVIFTWFVIQTLMTLGYTYVAYLTYRSRVWLVTLTTGMFLFAGSTASLQQGYDSDVSLLIGIGASLLSFALFFVRFRRRKALPDHQGVNEYRELQDSLKSFKTTLATHEDTEPFLIGTDKQGHFFTVHHAHFNEPISVNHKSDLTYGGTPLSGWMGYTFERVARALPKKTRFLHFIAASGSSLLNSKKSYIPISLKDSRTNEEHFVIFVSAGNANRGISDALKDFPYDVTSIDHLEKIKDKLALIQ